MSAENIRGLIARETEQFLLSQKNMPESIEIKLRYPGGISILNIPEEKIAKLMKGEDNK